MKTVLIFEHGHDRVINLPKDLDFKGISELEISREGDCLILRPIRPTWCSFTQSEKADGDYLTERENIASSR